MSISRGIVITINAVFPANKIFTIRRKKYTAVEIQLGREEEGGAKKKKNSRSRSYPFRYSVSPYGNVRLHGSQSADGDGEQTKGLLYAGLGVRGSIEDLGRDSRRFVRQHGHHFFPQPLLPLRVDRDVVKQGAARVAGL